MLMCCYWSFVAGKGNWRDGGNVRDSDRESVPRGKHSRDDLRDERYSAAHIATKDHSFFVVLLENVLSISGIRCQVLSVYSGFKYCTQYMFSRICLCCLCLV